MICDITGIVLESRSMKNEQGVSYALRLTNGSESIQVYGLKPRRVGDIVKVRAEVYYSFKGSKLVAREVEGAEVDLIGVQKVLFKKGE